jgi:hypothetical protein
MPRYQFALSDSRFVRQVGMVQCDSLDDAMTAVADRFVAAAGDHLEIGVHGFPPARYLYVHVLDSNSGAWRPIGAKAA